MTFEQTVLEQYFSKIKFVDQREQNVFLSYLRGFSLLFFDSTVKNIVEIGGGQSTAIFALMAERLGCKIHTIDMNPEAIKGKVRCDKLCDKIYTHVNFLRGVSISHAELASWYERDHRITVADEFIETTMDGRKEPAVLNALGITKLNAALLETSPIFSRPLLDIFRTPNDEFEFLPTVKTKEGLLAKVMGQNEIDAVFLDSGEFSSLPEWDIVSDKLRVGGYVILHDIFFPKSFKNWLVCASIRANPNWEIIYIDRTVPQGLMVARKKK